MAKSDKATSFKRQCLRYIEPWIGWVSSFVGCCLFLFLFPVCFPYSLFTLFILKKPSKSSKSKDYDMALERRLELSKKVDFLLLIREADALQQRLPKGISNRDLATTSKEFRDRKQKENVNTGWSNCWQIKCTEEEFFHWMKKRTFYT